MRRVWGMVRDSIIEYVCCESDGTWHYMALPVCESNGFDKDKSKPVPKNSAIRKVKMWGFPLSDPEDEDEEIEVL